LDICRGLGRRLVCVVDLLYFHRNGSYGVSKVYAHKENTKGVYGKIFWRDYFTNGQGDALAALLDVSAILSGEVEIHDHASVWPQAVLRGDLNKIVIGSYSNVQDMCVLHVEDDIPCIVGEKVTIGHNACLHACTIGNEVLIGMGATVLSGAKIEDRVIVGACSLVPENAVLESGFVYYGSPVKKARPLKPEELKYFDKQAKKYNRLGQEHMNGRFGRIGLVAD